MLNCLAQLTIPAKAFVLFISISTVFIYQRYQQRPLTEAQLHQKGLWKSPKLAIDAYIVKHILADDSWHILLIQRNREPYKDHWAFPGGFVAWMEDPVDATRREVAEETHLEVEPSVEPVFVNFRGSPHRDPRTHTASVGYATRVTVESLARLQRDSDVGDVKWWPIAEARGPLPMAFDHKDMLVEFWEWFQKEGKQRYKPYVEVPQ